jgi:hypothetical protein
MLKQTNKAILCLLRKSYGDFYITNGQKILIYIKMPHGSFAERNMLAFINIKPHAWERQLPLPAHSLCMNRPNISILN